MGDCEFVVALEAALETHALALTSSGSPANPCRWVQAQDTNETSYWCYIEILSRSEVVAKD